MNSYEESAPISQEAYDRAKAMGHKRWLENEYRLWAEALQSCTVNNFKEHPMVKRMLGEPDKHLWRTAFSANESPILSVAECLLLQKIDNIGRGKESNIDGRCIRMMYYAQRIIERNPSSIVEIGGGVGQFYAILRALGYKGEYQICDLPEVRKFQSDYLKEVSKVTGLSLPLDAAPPCEMVVSFYALGEFTDELKQMYQPIFDHCPHGYIAWNPHSGATDDLSIFAAHDIKVTPGIEEGIKIIEW